VKKLLSIKEASQAFGIGTQRLRELARVDPSMPIIKIGTVTKLNRDMMDSWIDERTKSGKGL
jgi:hypothetical protein